MYLLIDDCRTNGDVVATTAEAGRAMLQAGQAHWSCIGFDHDLGSDETGYDVLNWAIERNLLPHRVQLVTSNPVGRKNMTAALVAAGFKTVDGYNFKRVVQPGASA